VEKLNGEFNLELLYYYHTVWMDKELSIPVEELKDFYSCVMMIMPENLN